MSRPTITLPPLAHPVDELWHVLLDLAETLRAPWTLVGGQMVLLHALEHGQVPPQISQDGDSTGIPVRALEGYRKAATLVDSADRSCHLKDWLCRGCQLPSAGCRSRPSYSH